jgi:hypothetical protein
MIGILGPIQWDEEASRRLRTPCRKPPFEGKGPAGIAENGRRGNFRPFDERALGIFYREGGDVHMAMKKKASMKKKSMKKAPKKK